MRDFVRELPFLRLSLALGIRSKRNQVRMKDYWKIDVTATLAEGRQSLIARQRTQKSKAVSIAITNVESVRILGVIKVFKIVNIVRVNQSMPSSP